MRALTVWQRRATPGRSTVDSAGADAWRKAFLVCGMAASLLYAAMIWGIRYEGYSVLSHVPSELTAIGAPTRALWARLGWIYTVLMTAFGFGLWHWAGRNRAVRAVGGLILAHASLGLLWPIAAMHRREVLASGGATWTDTMHVVLGGVTVVLMFLAIGFGARAFGSRFRLYSIVSIVVLLAFGALTFVDAPRLQANLPTPWIGLWERINITVFLVWVVVLAVLQWRHGTATDSDRRSIMQARPGWIGVFLASVLLSTPDALRAQARFGTVSDTAIAALPGLRVVTLRDNDSRFAIRPAQSSSSTRHA